MDTTKLVVGQDVFMRSGEVGDWAKVVEVTSTGVIVESDPNYGARLYRFDENGTVCESSDLCNDKGIRGGLAVPTQRGCDGPLKLALSNRVFARIMSETERLRVQNGDIRWITSEGASVPR